MTLDFKSVPGHQGQTHLALISVLDGVAAGSLPLGLRQASVSRVGVLYRMASGRVLFAESQTQMPLIGILNGVTAACVTRCGRCGKGDERSDQQVIGVVRGLRVRRQQRPFGNRLPGFHQVLGIQSANSGGMALVTPGAMTRKPSAE